MMPSKQEGISLAFVLLNVLVLYYMLVQVYSYLIVLLVLYIGYRVVQVQVEETVDVAGKSVLITGCDSGFGHDLALKLESLGFTVYAGCLSQKSEGAKTLGESNSGRLHVLHLDVTNESNITDAVQYVRKHSKDTGLWAVVNNAGIQRVGDIELIPVEQMKRVAEVNLYGMVRVTKAFIPMIRKSKGRIVNVSSIKGRFAVAEDSSYSCTKFAIEAFSDVLRREMSKFDVTVVIVQPGHFGAATSVCGKAMCDIMEKDLKDAWKAVPADVQALYGWDYVSALIQGTRQSGSDGSPTTTACVDAMVDALINTCPKTRYLAHGGAKWFDSWSIICVLSSYLPDSAMDFLLSYLAPSPKLAIDAKP